MPSSALSHRATCQKRQGRQFRFCSQLAQKNPRNKPPGRSRCRVGGVPRGRRRCSERARGFLSFRGTTCGAALRKIPRQPDSPRIVETPPAAYQESDLALGRPDPPLDLRGGANPLDLLRRSSVGTHRVGLGSEWSLQRFGGG
jgi:hypothetical protein